MRSSKLGLRQVASDLGVWRKRREGRRIPTELWDAAVALLAEHSSSEICRVLRLNPTQFKKAREARGVAVGMGLCGRRGQRNASRGSARRAWARPRSRGRSDSRAAAFVELPALSASSGVAPFGGAFKHGLHVCRLSIEGPMGALTITMPAVERDLADIVRRCVAAALGEPSAA